MSRTLFPCITALLLIFGHASAQQKLTEVRAARSVHFFWPSADATEFYNEMIVDESTKGSYFAACAWNTGYFGIQELGDGSKVAIFSVWDPTIGDDPDAVSAEERVELLHKGDDVRIKRFGGEGTGGQCMMGFDWQIGQLNRLLVRVTRKNGKTAYEGHLWIPSSKNWKHLVTFRTRTGDKAFNGFYSFVEDFRRDGASVHETRSARFSNSWSRTEHGGHWLSLRRARFTASGADWESKDNIDGYLDDTGWFHLRTGGEISKRHELGTILERPPLRDLPE